MDYDHIDALERRIIELERQAAVAEPAPVFHPVAPWDGFAFTAAGGANTPVTVLAAVRLPEGGAFLSWLVQYDNGDERLCEISEQVFTVEQPDEDLAEEPRQAGYNRLVIPRRFGA